MTHREPIPDSVIVDIMNKLESFEPAYIEEETTPRRVAISISTKLGEYYVMLERM